MPTPESLRILREIASCFDDKVAAMAVLLDAWEKNNRNLLFDPIKDLIRFSFIKKTHEGARKRKEHKLPSPVSILEESLRN